MLACKRGAIRGMLERAQGVIEGDINDMKEG